MNDSKLTIFGEFTYDEELDWFYSQQISIPCLNGRECQFIISSGEVRGKLPSNLSKYIETVNNFITRTDDIWIQCSNEMYNYNSDIRDAVNDDGGLIDNIEKKDIWKHVRMGYGYDGKPSGINLVEDDDGEVYVSIEGGCDWELEHGVQIVIKNGLSVSKLGPYDGHLTNEHAFANAKYRGIIYVSGKML